MSWTAALGAGTCTFPTTGAGTLSASDLRHLVYNELRQLANYRPDPAPVLPEQTGDQPHLSERSSAISGVIGSHA